MSADPQSCQTCCQPCAQGQAAPGPSAPSAPSSPQPTQPPSTQHTADMSATSPCCKHCAEAQGGAQGHATPPPAAPGGPSEAPGRPHSDSPPPHAAVPSALRPTPKTGPAPCYMPQPEDNIPPNVEPMGPIGPWATGRVDWSPLSGLTGTRPVVDKYSIARYSEGEWRRHNKEVIEMGSREQHKMSMVNWNGRQCMQQTQFEVDKNQEDNTKRLKQRELEVHRYG